MEAAAFDDVRIELVAETHVHADFLSGAEALAGEAGAELLLSAEGGDEGTTARLRRTGARGLRHGDSLSLGRVRLDVRHTPGHTPEHIVFVVTDEATSELAVGIVSGDFLFVGDVGRPDLLERAVGIEGSMRRSAAELFRSLQSLRGLPEYLQLLAGPRRGLGMRQIAWARFRRAPSATSSGRIGRFRSMTSRSSCARCSPTSRNRPRTSRG